ncbi:MAG: hypothetical protein D6790_19015 [Caldilineae bacterium]|nr:MAG: hypothetical protein D6790_19015 [Caldilineae bacterium]
MTTANATTVAVVSDTHFWPGAQVSFGGQEEQLQPWSEEIHRTFLAEIRRLAPDYLIHLGDFSCGGGVFNMPVEAFCATVIQLHQDYRNLPLAYHAIPGNHDCPQGATDYSFIEQLLGLPARQGCTIDLPWARLVLLNAQGHSQEQMEAALPNDPIYGWVDDQELARLERELAGAGERPVILLTHQLLRPWSNGQHWADFYAIRNREAVLAIMAQHGNVRAVIQGHAHLLDAQQASVGGHPVHFIVNPSLIQYPLGWLLLTFQEKEMTVQYRPLPLPALRAHSLEAAPDSTWRYNPEATSLHIPL